MPDRMVKIAVLFRGPVRPDVRSVAARCGEFMAQLGKIQNATCTTYLATWRTWRQSRASDLLAMDLFDNVIMQSEPTDAQIERVTRLKRLPNGAEIRPVFNMYYQSKTALDVISAADDYDFIVHSRTDMVMDLGDHLPEWFDGNAYSSPHVPGTPAPHAPHIRPEDLWICDQFGVSSAPLMHRAWDYGSLPDLGRRIEAADIPERVLQSMIEEAGIPMKAPPHRQWALDPRRNS